MEMEKLIKYVCKSCGLAFWANPKDEPRFCPYCEMSKIIPQN